VSDPSLRIYLRCDCGWELDYDPYVIEGELTPSHIDKLDMHIENCRRGRWSVGPKTDLVVEGLPPLLRTAVGFEDPPDHDGIQELWRELKALFEREDAVDR